MDAAQAITRADVEAHDTRAVWRDNARIRTLCPFPACAGHTGPEHRSLSIDTATGLYKCHRCKADGKLRDYWDERPRTSTSKRKQAAALRAITAPPPAAPVVNPDKAPPPETQIRYAAAFPGSPAETYLEGRGIPPGVAQAHRCGFAVWKEWQPGEDGRLECVGEYPRATFPVRTLDGALVAIQGRAVGECPDSVPSKKTKGELKPGVFNPDAVRTSAPIITEAPIDALSLATCGYPAIALMGTTVRPWLSSAFPLGCTVYLGTDADDAGDKAAGELNRAIRLSRCERLRPPEPWKDWNAALCGLGRDALAAWLAERIPPAVPTATTTTATTSVVTTPARPAEWQPGNRAFIELDAGWFPCTVVDVWKDTPDTSTDARCIGRVEVQVDGRSYHVTCQPGELQAVNPATVPALPSAPLIVYSRTLGESVLVVETAARLPAPVAGEPVTYTRVELALLAGQPADVLRNAHLLKRHFGGFCVGVPDAEPALS